MKQVLQSLRTGEVHVETVPAPNVHRNGVLVRVAFSLVSSGTERMVTELARKNLLEKARARPDLVRQVLDKVRREGLLPTMEAVQNRLDQPLALGYSCAGTVIATGSSATELRAGERVACAGGSAAHAEVVSVPEMLVARVPDAVDLGHAAFTTLGAIALHGVRLAAVNLGETVAVIGLGLLGQLTVQILEAWGCRVVGLDPKPARAELSRRLGADRVATEPEEFLNAVHELCRGAGADAVLITADTPSNEPVELAGRIARDRAVVVAVGAVGLEVPRKLYYEKELDLRISRSYGPGRYDPNYEEKAVDYPIGYVRWTENRNMQAFLRLLEEGKLNTQPLITHRFPVADAARAYELITGKPRESFLGVLLVYSESPDVSRRVELKPPDTLAKEASRQQPGRGDARPVRVGLVGAGNFATATLLPAMKKVTGVDFVGVCTATGMKGHNVGKRFGFAYCTTDENELLGDPDINVVVIATRHNLHATQALRALNAGKRVFCEKPLALNEEDLLEIVRTVSNQAKLPLAVGYNRRFAPMARRLKDFLSKVGEPLVVNYRINAGFIGPEHWVQDPEQGGGRIVGEVCHFIDFVTFLVDELPVSVQTRALPNRGRYRDDNVVLTVGFGNGSIGTILYLANGDKSLPKERIEVFGGGRAAVLEDFRRLELFHHGRRRRHTSRLRQDKGHRAEWEAFVSSCRTDSDAPIPLEELVSTSLVTFRALESLETGETVAVDTVDFLRKAREQSEGKVSDPR